MESARSASGDAWTALAKLLTILVLAYASYLVITSLHVKQFLESSLPLELPFKSIAVFGGVMYILWIRLARDLCGSGYGIATALLIASLCLATSPWFGVTNPWWFSVYGIASFLAAAILIEKNLGFASNACFCLINWAAAWIHGVSPVSAVGLGVGIGIALTSGWAGDLAGIAVARALLRIDAVKALYRR